MITKLQGDSQIGKYQILRDLSTCNPHSRLVLFIRHAERYPIAKAGEGNDVALTENGMQTAKDLGRTIPNYYRLLLSNTGMRRTIQTCDAIEAGFLESSGNVQEIGPVQSTCASYVVNAQELFAMANALGEKFVSHWLKGKIAHSIIEPPELATHHLLKRVMDPSCSNCKLPETNELHIHVAYDWDVYVLRYALLGIEPEPNPVNYLDGIVFAIQDDEMEVRSLGKSQKLPKEWIPWRNGNLIPTRL